MPEHILIYYPHGKRSNVIETLAGEFRARGHRVFLLSQGKEEALHQVLREQGIQTFSPGISGSPSPAFYLKQLLHLVRFCRQHKITAIQSHLQPANIVAVMARFFIKARVVAYRHHLFENNANSRRFDRLINALAPVIVVPSSVILEKMVKEEKVPASKVRLIPYVYDFSKYSSDAGRVAELKRKYPARLLVLLCGRFVPLKRNELAILAVAALVRQQKDVKLLALDAGPELDKCRALAEAKGLRDHVVFAGYTEHPLDYLAACDVLVHPSFTEASNNTVKEASLFSKAVIACEGVGDFSDYIIHGENGYLINREDPLPGLISCLNDLYEGKADPGMGARLKETVFEKFSKSDHTIHNHLILLTR